MAITLLNPEGVPKTDILHQVSVATGSKMVFIAGQVAWDADGRTVGEGDFAAQVEQCFLNVATALAGVGGSFGDVAKLTIYVPDWTMDKYPLLEEGIARAAAKLGVTPTPPASLIGISAGFTPDLMVEVEAIAVID
ncbi:MAG: RidA/YER057c/UK114 superfamily protein [uncultured Truepera sp.]|uniref:RidA/YER057c/UK114 superfamily protein n=1 Tax=uncultured Truepera sp. TaxID=543023 RepID=A0A6J4UXQ6_9DEIN|nr:MAG: RidA/YER057c/UK114 superfamily protein [uncultured Truepera sp.]